MKQIAFIFVLVTFIVSCGVRGPLVPPKRPMSFFDIGQEKNTDVKKDKEVKKNESK